MQDGPDQLIPHSWGLLALPFGPTASSSGSSLTEGSSQWGPSWQALGRHSQHSIGRPFGS